MSLPYKNCQSCGMPLTMDQNGGGTEVDGSKSLKYCSYCYVDGLFVDDFKSAVEMQHFCKVKLGEMGYGRFKQWLFTLNIPRLERWRVQKG